MLHSLVGLVLLSQVRNEEQQAMRNCARKLLPHKTCRRWSTQSCLLIVEGSEDHAES